MSRTKITPEKLISLTQEVLYGFYTRSIDHLIHYLSDDFMWIGAFDFQFATTKQQFLDIIQSELDAVPFHMDNECYNLITRDRDTFVLYCKFNLTSLLPTGSSLQMHTRMSVVWKYIGNELKLVHIHGSNAQDILLVNKVQEDSSSDPSENFIDYIVNSVKKSPTEKKMFRMVTGEHCLLTEHEILYLQADGQNTKIHTTKAVFTASGVLRTHQAYLSNSFFRIHKSYLVHTDYVTSFRRYQVTLCNRIDLPIGKEKYLPLKTLCSQTNKD